MRMYAMPDIATGTPWMLNAKRPIGSSSGYRSRIIPSTTRFVDVPISVHVPPRMDAKDSGMKSCALCTPILCAHFCNIGIMIATTGVLFRNAETNAMGTMRRICADAASFGWPNSRPM